MKIVRGLFVILLLSAPAKASPICADGYHSEIVGGYGGETKCVPYASGGPTEQETSRHSNPYSSGISGPGGRESGVKTGAASAR